LSKAPPTPWSDFAAEFAAHLPERNDGAGGSVRPIVESPRRSGDRRTNALGMAFVWVPPGEFLMGSPPTEAGRAEDETRHRVTLPRGFFLGTFPVTQRQWEKVFRSNPSRFRGPDLPVENVTWLDALEFCRKLTAFDGRPYRLPTEAEWEYACRAGTQTPFHFGGRISTDQANYDGTSPYGAGRSGTYRRSTTPVGSFAANFWGLFDMHGNVWEWCQDPYADYPIEPATDPAPAAADDHRVARGGAWNLGPAYCRSAARLRLRLARRCHSVGVRVCLAEE
jgi:formylglycine-generating enzyme required for sulfatase activity